MLLGYAFTGSFCTISKSIEIMKNLVDNGIEIVPIMSENAYYTDTRFGDAERIRNEISKICKRECVHTIVDAEPLGPRTKLDALIISPCTGNTLSKIANGITDTAVCMAAKAHLRNNRPLIIALATNDALSANLKNIATLMSRKNVYFTPMIQDDPILKPHSLVADFNLIEETLTQAVNGKQLTKIFI